MFSHLGGWTGVILLVIILLVFAAPKLPMFAKNLSQSIRIFKDEMKPEEQPSTGPTGATTTPTTPAAPAQPDASTTPTTGPETPSNGSTPNTTH